MEKYMRIGTVLKPQGIRGEIKILPETDTPGDIKKYGRIFIGGEEHTILSARVSGDFAYVSLSGVTDRDAAEFLRGKEITALREEVPPPPEGRYYIEDLIGCAVVADGVLLGTVTDVTPAKTDVYEIETKGKTRAFAAADGVIEDVDIGGKTITVNRKRFNECSLDY